MALKVALEDHMGSTKACSENTVKKCHETIYLIFFIVGILSYNIVCHQISVYFTCVSLHWLMMF